MQQMFVINLMTAVLAAATKMLNILM